MNAELQAIKDAHDAANEAKHKSLVAVGEAKLAEKEGRQADADKAWAIVAKQGFSSGIEGQKRKEAVSLSDAYVDAHPDEFTIYRDMEEDDLVHTLEVLRDGGLTEAWWRVQVWLFHRFEPRHIGGPLKGVVRIRGAK